MPWADPKEFAERHNKKLKGSAAKKAKDVAEAMMRRGVDEGEAIATGNKRGNEAMRRGNRRKVLYDGKKR